jgi:hypothetical protein
LDISCLSTLSQERGKNLPVTGLIDPPFLKGLKLTPVPQVENITERKGRLFNPQRGVLLFKKDGHFGKLSSYP